MYCGREKLVKFIMLGLAFLQWRNKVAVFQKGPLFPKKTLNKKQRRANFGPPTALGPRALHALHALLLRHCVPAAWRGNGNVWMRHQSA